eukprot:CAMPEP_0174865804 /NCGR_PEP_ID=MMETSP1114-20130205/61008_1 /TAXON_ID=312471 /ORGANISM="Neobodo designis, Strain CCAP 1951/1" /LENGTH=157 /DNA_ID=CAMNT_0016100939 /DNA_START=65 /DNA_END=535 /DNA_ORIENTATION=+
MSDSTSPNAQTSQSRDVAAPATRPEKPRSAQRQPLPCVISVKKAVLREHGYADLLEWKGADPERHVYIGRGMAHYVKGADASVWGNPFPLKKHTLAESLQLYEQHVRNGPLWERLGELRGATELGCWCKPAGCHGDVLVRLLAEKFGDAAVDAAAVD